MTTLKMKSTKGEKNNIAITEDERNGEQWKSQFLSLSLSLFFHLSPSLASHPLLLI